MVIIQPSALRNFKILSKAVFCILISYYYSFVIVQRKTSLVPLVMCNIRGYYYYIIPVFNGQTSLFTAFFVFLHFFAK